MTIKVKFSDTVRGIDFSSLYRGGFAEDGEFRSDQYMQFESKRDDHKRLLETEVSDYYAAIEWYSSYRSLVV